MIVLLMMKEFCCNLGKAVIIIIQLMCKKVLDISKLQLMENMCFMALELKNSPFIWTHCTEVHKLMILLNLWSGPIQLQEIPAIIIPWEIKWSVKVFIWKRINIITWNSIRVNLIQAGTINMLTIFRFQWRFLMIMIMLQEMYLECISLEPSSIPTLKYSSLLKRGLKVDTSQWNWSEGKVSQLLIRIKEPFLIIVQLRTFSKLFKLFQVIMSIPSMEKDLCMISLIAYWTEVTTIKMHSSMSGGSVSINLDKHSISMKNLNSHLMWLVKNSSKWKECKIIPLWLQEHSPWK